MAIRKKADRAKLFIPFDALKGLKEALREKEKVLCEKKELTEEEIEEISFTLKQINKRDIVKVKYFASNEYLFLQGMVSSIDFTLKKIKVIKTITNFDDILNIEIEGHFE